MSQSADDAVRSAAASVRREQGGSADRQESCGDKLADSDFDEDRMTGGEDDSAMADRPAWMRSDTYFIW